MGNRKISADVKLAAICLGEKNLMNVSDILECVGFSKRTFYCVLKLYRDTGNVVKAPSNHRGRP